MALTVATNTGALMAQAAASSVNKEMEMSMERLSTGKRINSAADDAAGVAIASRLTAEIRGTNQAIRNAMDGQAMIDTAEGAHQEIESLLQRMRELAVQSANDSNDSTDRANLQSELDALTNEIDRISSVTTWAGQSLLNGAGGTSSNGTFTFQVGSQTNSADTISATIGSMSAASLGVGSGNAVASATAGSISLVGGNVIQVAGEVASGDVYSFDLNGDTVSVTIGSINTSGDVSYSYAITGGDSGSGTASGSSSAALVGAAQVFADVVNSLEVSGGQSGINAVAASDGSVTITQSVVATATGSGGNYTSGGAISATSSVNVSTATTTLTFGSGDLAVASLNTSGSETFALTINGESITYSTASGSGDFSETMGGLVAGIQEQIDANSNLKGLTVTAASGGGGDTLTISIAASVTIANVTTSNAAATSSLDITTASGSTSAINAIDTAIQSVNSQRASLGSVSNRLDSTVSNLTNISNNLAAGKGRIEDADFAAETTTLAKSQILQQASTAMLAQANASKQNVLSLLQG